MGPSLLSMRWASIRLALQTLRANPLRTTLSTLGIIMGAASLAAVLSIGDGAEAFARQRLEREGMQVVVLTPKTSDLVDGQRVPRQHIAALGAADGRDDCEGGRAGLQRHAHTSRHGPLASVPGGTALRAAALSGRLSLGAPLPVPIAAGRDLSLDEMRGGAPPWRWRPIALAEAVAGTGASAQAVGRDILAGDRTVADRRHPGRARPGAARWS